MAQPEFNRTEEFEALDWRDRCVTDRRFGGGWPVYKTAAWTWEDAVRERVARRARKDALRTADDALAAWTAESTEATRAEFDQLAEVWRRETAGAPFVITRTTHWAYQRIIGMGPKVVPLLLEDLLRGPSHWYWALNAITGEDPAEGIDRFDEAAARWLDWGRKSGLLSEG